MNIIRKETRQTVQSKTYSNFRDEGLFRTHMSVRPKQNNDGINLPAHKVVNSFKVEMQ